MVSKGIKKIWLAAFAVLSALTLVFGVASMRRDASKVSAADQYVHFLSEATSETSGGVTTYTWSFSEEKLNKGEVLVEVPDAGDEGFVFFSYSSSNSGRFAFIYKDNGTVADSTRRMQMYNGYSYFSESNGVTYNSGDIFSSDGKYFLRFGSNEDYKIKGLKLVSKGVIVKYDVVFVVDGTQLGETQKVTENGYATAPSDPEKTGYDFKGWSPAVASTPITAETTFTAQFDVHNYSITYELDGGVNDSDNPASYTIEDETITLKNPVKDGYKFTGWTEGNVIAAGSTGDKTFTANWLDESIVTYDLTFSAINGSVDNSALTVAEGTAYSVSGNVLTIGEKTITATAEGDSAYSYGFDGFIAGGSALTSGTIGSDMDVVATFSKTAKTVRTITVKYNNGEADGTAYAYDGEAATIADPERAGWTFIGWVDTDFIDVDLDEVTEDMTIIASYERNEITVLNTDYQIVDGSKAMTSFDDGTFKYSATKKDGTAYTTSTIKLDGNAAYIEFTVPAGCTALVKSCTIDSNGIFIIAPNRDPMNIENGDDIYYVQGSSTNALETNGSEMTGGASGTTYYLHRAVASSTTIKELTITLVRGIPTITIDDEDYEVNFGEKVANIFDVYGLDRFEDEVGELGLYLGETRITEDSVVVVGGEYYTKRIKNIIGFAEQDHVPEMLDSATDEDILSKLPAYVVAELEGGDTAEISVASWNVVRGDGQATATATLTIGEDFTVEDGVNVHPEYVVILSSVITIDAFDELSDVYAPFGTEKTALVLPDKATFDGVDFDITDWANDDYDGNVIGEYIFTATVAEKDGYEFSGVILTVAVKVVELTVAYANDVFTVPEVGALSALPATVTVTDISYNGEKIEGSVELAIAFDTASYAGGAFGGSIDATITASTGYAFATATGASETYSFKAYVIPESLGGWTFTTGDVTDSSTLVDYAFRHHATAQANLKPYDIAIAKNAAAKATYTFVAPTDLDKVTLTIAVGSKETVDNTIVFRNEAGEAITVSGMPEKLGSGNWTEQNIVLENIAGVKTIEIGGASKWLAIKGFEAEYGNFVTIKLVDAGQKIVKLDLDNSENEYTLDAPIGVEGFAFIGWTKNGSEFLNAGETLTFTEKTQATYYAVYVKAEFDNVAAIGIKDATADEDDGSYIVFRVTCAYNSEQVKALVSGKALVEWSIEGAPEGVVFEQKASGDKVYLYAKKLGAAGAISTKLYPAYSINGGEKVVAEFGVSAAKIAEVALNDVTTEKDNDHTHEITVGDTTVYGRYSESAREDLAVYGELAASEADSDAPEQAPANTDIPVDMPRRIKFRQ